jgi:ABC-type multidrug transport system permease subunit
VTAVDSAAVRWSGSWALLRHEFRRAWRSKVPRAIFVGLPLLLAWVILPAFHYATLLPNGGGNPVAQVLGGQVVMFSLISLVFTGHAVFSDREHHVDQRLMAAGLSRGWLYGSKLVVTFLTTLVFSVIVFVAGRQLLGHIDIGSVVAWALLLGAWAAVATALSLVFIGTCRRSEAFTLATYGGSILIAAGAGGLAPWGLLPSWAVRIAPLFPSSPLLRAIDRVPIGGPGAIRSELLQLTGWAVGLGLVGVLLNRFAERSIRRTPRTPRRSSTTGIDR